MALRLLRSASASTLSSRAWNEVLLRHSVHVEAAHRAALQRRAGVERLVHVSGIGSDPASRSLCIRRREESEQAVRAAFADAVLLRPAVMFDGGLTRLQTVSVEDVGEAIARLMTMRGNLPKVVECGGPRIYAYKELVRSVAREAGVRPILIPMPFVVWHALARVMGMLPAPPVSRHSAQSFSRFTLGNIVEKNEAAKSDALGTDAKKEQKVEPSDSSSKSVTRDEYRHRHGAAACLLQNRIYAPAFHTIVAPLLERFASRRVSPFMSRVQRDQPLCQRGKRDVSSGGVDGDRQRADTDASGAGRPRRVASRHQGDGSARNATLLTPALTRLFAPNLDR